MNASINSTEDSARTGSADSPPTHQPLPHRGSPPSALKKWAVIFAVFATVTGVTWVGLTSLTQLHNEGRLLQETTVNTVLLLGVAFALIVVVPVIVRTVQSAKQRVDSGEGLLSSASDYLDTNTENPLLTQEDFETGVVKNLLGAVSNPSEAEQAAPADADLCDNSASAELAVSHEEATQRIQEFNVEMENLFPRWQQRIGAYEQRVDELERELASKESENGELIQRQIELVNQHLDLARDRASEEGDTEFDVKTGVDTRELHGGTAIAERLKSVVGPATPKVSEAERAAEMSRQFKHDTESLSKQEKVRVYQERIAKMEDELAGTEAENKELTWNQLQYMQKRLAGLTHGMVEAPTPAPLEPAAIVPMDGTSHRQSQIRRKAAMNVAELNARLAGMYPDGADLADAYEDRLSKIEEMISTQTTDQREILECQREMTRNYMRLMEGTPELGQPAPATNDVLSQMFGLEFGLNPVDQEAARNVAELNCELSRNNSTNDEQMMAYRERIAELESAVENQPQDGQDLSQAQLELVQYQLEHLEATNLCDEPLNVVQPPPSVDESGVPMVRIPQYQRAEMKDEVPRHIRAMMDREHSELRIKGLKRKSPRQAAS